METRRRYVNLPIELFYGLIDSPMIVLSQVEQFMICQIAVEKYEDFEKSNFLKDYLVARRDSNSDMDQGAFPDFEDTFYAYWRLAYADFFKVEDNVHKAWEDNYDLWERAMLEKGYDKIVRKARSNYGYELAEYWAKLKAVPEEERWRLRMDKPRLGVPDFDLQNMCTTGLMLYLSYMGEGKAAKHAFVGVRHEDIMRVRNMSTRRYDYALFLFFLAIKSIIGPDRCKKITNQYILSRMDGYTECVASQYLSDGVLEFSTRHYITSMKNDLYDKWHLTYYAQNVRGCYYSFKMTTLQLVDYVQRRNTDTRAGRNKALASEHRKEVARAKEMLRERKKEG